MFYWCVLVMVYFLFKCRYSCFLHLSSLSWSSCSLCFYLSLFVFKEFLCAFFQDLQVNLHNICIDCGAAYSLSLFYTKFFCPYACATICKNDFSFSHDARTHRESSFITSTCYQEFISWQAACFAFKLLV